MHKSFFCLILIFLPFFIAFSAEQININTATLEQLDELTGIGPVYAQRIIDGRPFSSVDELDRVKGIGPATLQKIKEQGLACVDCVPTKSGDVGLPAGSPTSGEAAFSYPGGVVINEILPNPEGADETQEWVVSTIQRIASAYS